MISVFDLFSIGIGPSSSHTVGPMRATRVFIEGLNEDLFKIHKITITLYGSLAFTGKGHGTDKAIMMGLLGERPETVDPDLVQSHIEKIYQENQILINKKHGIPFSPLADIIFNYKETLPYHSNAMRFSAFSKAGTCLKSAIYYSIGGGFIINEDEINQTSPSVTIPYPFSTGAELLKYCEENKLTIAQVMLANELCFRNGHEIRQKLLGIAAAMHSCIDKGCRTTGILEGPLKVKRRAPAIYEKLIQAGKPSAQHPQAMTWLNVFAMAVNEENAAGGRVVTAPTNGAAGIIPAVLAYYRFFYPSETEGTEAGIIDFLLTAGAVGILYKLNASISGAEVGCQGEVGVACSMAAAGLAAALGGSFHQVENAAEIGMEHNLGLTCDPVGGRVQIPCIERNAMGAVKAVNAAHLALTENGDHKISLDMVINTMKEIGKNMNSIYKETSLGGLAVAVNVIEC